MDIETVTVGDRVWAFDHRRREWLPREVVKISKVEQRGRMATLDVGGETIRATGGHPFWVVQGDGLEDRPQPGEVAAYEYAGRQPGRWVLARDLRAGDSVLLRDGREAVLGPVGLAVTVETVYNFHVAELQNYAVGWCGVLVHNTNPADPGPTPTPEPAPAKAADPPTPPESPTGSGSTVDPPPPPPRPGDPGLKWGNPKSKPTYGHTFIDHGQKVKNQQLIDRARTKDLNFPDKSPHQIGAWVDDKKAADIIAEAVRGRSPGDVFDIPLSATDGRSFLGDGTALTVDRARIVIGADGSVTSAYPFSSTVR